MKAPTLFVLVSCVVTIAVGDTYGQITPAQTGMCYATPGSKAAAKVLMTINTGDGTVSSTVALSDPNGGYPGLAINSNGDIYATRSDTGAIDLRLVRIDAATGDVTVVGSMPDGFVDAIAFDANDVLYGYGDYPGTLFQIDLTTADWTPTDANFGTSHYAGLAFDPTDGTLFASTSGLQDPAADQIAILTINGASSTETLLPNPTGTGGGAAIPDIAFTADGSLFGVKGGGSGVSKLISIDKTTGIGATVGSGLGYQVSGLACFNPPPATDKVYVCHVQGRSGKVKTLHIDAGSEQDHLDHGDTKGPCPEEAGKADESPASFLLSQNYPNPFNPTTTISFVLPEAGPVRLAVYNTVGQEVKVLVSGTFESGTHSMTWDGTDQYGQHVATGIYLYRLSAGNHVETRKMLLLE